MRIGIRKSVNKWRYTIGKAREKKRRFNIFFSGSFIASNFFEGNNVLVLEDRILMQKFLFRFFTLQMVLQPTVFLNTRWNVKKWSLLVLQTPSDSLGVWRTSPNFFLCLFFFCPAVNLQKKSFFLLFTLMGTDISRYF